jgi:hypothetical protein
MIRLFCDIGGIVDRQLSFHDKLVAYQFQTVIKKHFASFH